MLSTAPQFMVQTLGRAIDFAGQYAMVTAGQCVFAGGESLTPSGLGELRGTISGILSMGGSPEDVLKDDRVKEVGHELLGRLLSPDFEGADTFIATAPSADERQILGLMREGVVKAGLAASRFDDFVNVAEAYLSIRETRVFSVVPNVASDAGEEHEFLAKQGVTVADILSRAMDFYESKASDETLDPQGFHVTPSKGAWQAQKKELARAVSRWGANGIINDGAINKDGGLLLENTVRDNYDAFIEVVTDPDERRVVEAIRNYVRSRHIEKTNIIDIEKGESVVLFSLNLNDVVGIIDDVLGSR